MSKNPRLRFTDDERQNPALKKSVQKADKAASKADKAQAKIPKKAVKTNEPILDPKTGKVTSRIVFEDKKKPPSKLAHAVKSAPGNALKSQVHKEIRKSEDDNVGVESAHKLEQAAETGGRLVQSAYRSYKLKPYKKATAAERRLGKVNVKALYKSSLRDNPELSSNPLSRWQQKRAIRKEYAAARRAGQSAMSTSQTTKAAKKAAEKAEKAAQFIRRNRKGILIAIAIMLIISSFLSGLSSCGILLEGGIGGLSMSTYPSEDSEMLAAEAAYEAMEAELQYELDNYETLHSGYDEYIYELDDIGHDPYVLISILSVLHGEFTLPEVQDNLAMLFEKQYTLTETVEIETRYRTETYSWIDEDGEIHIEIYEVAYDYYICTVTLTNFDLSHIPVYIMTEAELSMYAMYMSTLGNRPDLFLQSEYPNASSTLDYENYEIPPEALEDEAFAAMIAEAEKYLGYPYVYGGSSPSTSFDCSGFVCWVINTSGVGSVGRTTAQGLYNLCTPISSANAQPGDLVFFHSTYNHYETITHLGIYVGNGMMIHCGSPISYASIETSYWQSHLYGFARLP